MRYLLIMALFGAFVGCGNPCQELADKICDRAAADFDGCASLPEGSDPNSASAKACQRMEAVTLSCRVLKESAETASDEDKDACKADLELVRALERQQQ